MKKTLFLGILIIVLSGSSSLISQNTLTPVIATELISSGIYEGNAISVYKRNSDKIPYQVKATDKTGKAREFYIIKRVSDIYAYLMIEKRGKELLYYPLTWSDRKAIRVHDINERSKDILNGNIGQVNKNAL